MLGAFYLWLILLSAVNARVPDADPLQRLVRAHLGVVERCPRFIKWFLPLLLAGLAFLALHPLLARLGVIPAMKNRNHLLEQAAVIGLGSYLTWKYLIVGVLLLHLLNSYVYLGNSPLWAFINATAHGLLAPLSWLPLRVGRVDFGPPLAIVLTLLAGELAARGLPALYP